MDREEVLFEDKWGARLIMRRHFFDKDCMVLETRNKHEQPEPVEVAFEDLEKIICAIWEKVCGERSYCSEEDWSGKKCPLCRICLDESEENEVQ